MNERDNVATLLAQAEAGNRVQIVGAGGHDAVQACRHIDEGHKIALVSLKAGEPIVKLGVAIGRTTKDVPAGDWVHLHNLASNYDERSSSLDGETGAPTDTVYE